MRAATLLGSAQYKNPEQMGKMRRRLNCDADQQRWKPILWGPLEQGWLLEDVPDLGSAPLSQSSDVGYLQGKDIALCKAARLGNSRMSTVSTPSSW